MSAYKEARDICRVCQKLWQRDYVASNDGNVSARLLDGNILCTPTGVSKGEVTEDMLALLTPEGEKISGGEPSSEIKMHLLCYKLRPDIGGIVHAHPPAATAFAAAGLALDGRFLTEALMNFGAAPLAPFAMPGTDEVSASIAPLIPENDAVLLKNHGALTLGGDAAKAYYRMEALEHFALISLNVRALGGGADIPAERAAELAAFCRK